MNAEPNPFVAAAAVETEQMGAAERILETELRHIVQSIYGPSVRRLPGLDVGRAYWGATQGFRYGGDMADVFHCSDGRTALAVVDIAGHGIAAARHAGLTKYALRSYASLGFDALAAVRALNRLCIENCAFEGDEEFFATVFYGIVTPDRRRLQFVSAGHDAAYLVTPRGARPLLPSGPIVGLLDDDAAFTQREVQLDDGDIFAAATDGFSEARDESLAFLGSAALVEVIEAHHVEAAEYQAHAVTRRAFEYAGLRLKDDVAALVVRISAANAG